jgi:hypothetical protein
MPNLAKIKKERLKNDIRIGIWIHPLSKAWRCSIGACCVDAFDYQALAF